MEEFILRISPDKMSAYLTIFRSSGEEPTTFEKVVKYLEENRVVFGRIDDGIRCIIEQEKYGEEFMAAQGSPVTDGVDGKLEYFFNIERKNSPRERKDGSLDFYDLNITQNVCKGDQIAKLIPATDGQNGTNVFGEPIPPVKGKPVKLLRGKNTTYDESKTFLIAEIEGVIRIRADGTIEVSPSFAVSGDIDLSTGNLDIKGDLIIKGDVKAGFKVAASGNIEVGGTIEDAQVIAGGSVVVKGGFVGEGKGLIKAGGNVFLKFVDRQNIEAGGDIEVFEEAVQSKLLAGGSILVKKGKGILVGGNARAGRLVEANILGSEQYINTEVVVADSNELCQKISTRQKACAELESGIDEVAQKMTILMRKKKKMGLSQRDEDLFRRLDKESATTEHAIETARAEIDLAERELAERRNTAYIKIYKTVYPGVSMKIAGIQKKLENERQNTTFKAYGNEILGMEEVAQMAQR